MDNSVKVSKPVVEFQNALTQARGRLVEANAINGRVIKVFKPTAGVRELFLVNEPVVVMEADNDGVISYNVEGLTYDYKKNSVGNKTAVFTGEQLTQYVAYAK